MCSFSRFFKPPSWDNLLSGGSTLRIWFSGWQNSHQARDLKVNASAANIAVPRRRTCCYNCWWCEHWSVETSAQARVPSSFRHGFCPRYRPCFLGIPPRRTLKPFLPFFRFTKSHGIGYGMNSVGAAASKKLGVINNAVSVPLSFDVNRYFKPLWKPGHLLD